MSGPNPPRLRESPNLDLSSTLEGDLTTSASTPRSEALQAAQDDFHSQVVSSEDIEQLRQSFKELKALQQMRLDELEERIAATEKKALQAAQDAQIQAGTANAAANIATTRAVVADTISSTAKTTADIANRTASTANTTANTANTTAKNSNINANNAIRTANTANTTAFDLKNAETSRVNIRRRLFPWVIVPLVMNLFLRLSMLYIILQIQDYNGQRTQYLVRGWMIFIAPLVAVVAIFLIVNLSESKEHIDSISDFLEGQYWRFVAFLLNAAVCFALVIAYLFASALPTYTRSVFESSINYTNSLPWPSITFQKITDTNVTIVDCGVEFPFFGGLQECSNALQSMPADAPIEGQMFNASSLIPEEQYAIDFSDSILLFFQVTYNSTTFNGQAPRWIIQIFDPRMTLDDVSNCELVSNQVIPQLSDTAVGLTVEHIIDSHGILKPASWPGQLDADKPDDLKPNSECPARFRSLYSAKDPPLSAYTSSIIPTPILNASQCDVANAFQQPCLITVTLSFTSKLVRTTETLPGISKLDIWINAGAIVGAVQFFGWILKGLSS